MRWVRMQLPFALDHINLWLLRDEIEEGRQYYESRVPMRIRRDTEIFTETIRQFVQMKREVMEKVRTGT